MESLIYGCFYVCMVVDANQYILFICCRFVFYWIANRSKFYWGLYIVDRYDFYIYWDWFLLFLYRLRWNPWSMVCAIISLSIDGILLCDFMKFCKSSSTSAILPLGTPHQMTSWIECSILCQFFASRVFLSNM